MRQHSRSSLPCSSTPYKKIFFLFDEILLAWLDGGVRMRQANAQFAQRGVCRSETSLEQGADTTSIYQTAPTATGIAPIPGTGQSRVGL